MLLWQRAREPPFLGAWSLPGGFLEPARRSKRSIRRHLAAKVDVREVAHLEQLETRSDPKRHPGAASSPRPTSASSPRTSTRRCRRTRAGTPWTTCPSWRSTTARSRWPAASACAPSSPTRTSASRSRRRRSRSRSCGPSTGPRSDTTSRPRTCSACSSATVLEPTGERRAPGRAGGRPAAVLPLRRAGLEVTDQFAVLRPPGGSV